MDMEMFTFICFLVLFIGAIVLAVIITNEENLMVMFYGAVLCVLLIGLIGSASDVFSPKKNSHCVEIKSYKVDTTSTIINGIPTDTIYTLYYK